jgi:uncharacterized ferritin-like protein (DUF455 family)
VNTVRRQALSLLVTSDPHRKAALTRASSIDHYAAGSAATLSEPAGIPGRPARPELLAHDKLKQGSMGTLRGRAALIHALAHIELNAIDLALDLTWRFAGLPDEFYYQWLAVAQEEALHFELLRDHLRAMGYEYGDFPAHNALWEMAEKTKHDILARIALVPRTLEARGLDASPAVKAKLEKAGDHRGAEILDLILRDEIGHVAVGNRWYRWLCDQRGLDHIATYAELAGRYGAPRPRGPFNLEARRAAGFDEEELTYLARAT